MPITSVKVNAKNQLTLPKSMCEKLNIKAGDHLLVDVQDGIMVLIPQSESYTNKLQALHSEIWQDIDIKEYLNSERSDWTTS